MEKLREELKPSLIPAGPADSIRIVGLHTPGNTLEAAPGHSLASPQLTYRGGPVLSQVKVYNLFWGSAWGRPPQRDQAHELNRFVGRLLESPWMEQLGEYDLPGREVGFGRVLGSSLVTHTNLRGSVSDRAIQHMLTQEIAGRGGIAEPSPNTCYLIFAPPGLAVVKGGARSCQAFCGYHDHVEGQIFYAVVPYPQCRACTAGLAIGDALTVITSHVLAEVITDPVPGQGWYDDLHGEVCDVGPWMTRKIWDYTVQGIWSNRMGSCG